MGCEVGWGMVKLLLLWFWGYGGFGFGIGVWWDVGVFGDMFLIEKVNVDWEIVERLDERLEIKMWGCRLMCKLENKVVGCCEIWVNEEC